jgi:hypothetical protein
MQQQPALLPVYATAPLSAHLHAFSSSSSLLMTRCSAAPSGALRLPLSSCWLRSLNVLRKNAASEASDILQTSKAMPLSHEMCYEQSVLLEKGQQQSSERGAMTAGSLAAHLLLPCAAVRVAQRPARQHSCLCLGGCSIRGRGHTAGCAEPTSTSKTRLVVDQRAHVLTAVHTACRRCRSMGAA